MNWYDILSEYSGLIFMVVVAIIFVWSLRGKTYKNPMEKLKTNNKDCNHNFMRVLKMAWEINTLIQYTTRDEYEFVKSEFQKFKDEFTGIYTPEQEDEIQNQIKIYENKSKQLVS